MITYAGCAYAPLHDVTIYRIAIRLDDILLRPSRMPSSHGLKRNMTKLHHPTQPMGSRTQEQLIQHQELLIAELNHRARNSLQLISALIEQSVGSVSSVEDFAQLVNGRVKAMSRAHDLITRKDWNAVSFQELMRIEIDGFTHINRTQIQLLGTDALLNPEACATLALVMHEMLTNATKYGALSHDAGRLLIESSLGDDGNLQISWRELGVPDLIEPTHEGFGSTIIKGSIPFELGGDALTGVDDNGLYGEFVIPARHVSPTPTAYNSSAPTSERDATTHPTIKGTALLVEDSMLMAMGAERHLYALGAEAVIICQDIETAMTAIKDDPDIHFCLLDINLDGEYSTPIAQLLAAQGIPFVLATGYANDDRSLTDFPNAPLITKPYGLSDLVQALTDMTQLSQSQ